MRLPILYSDCSACSGLCCVSHHFERSRWFALDKQAGTPCPHLAGHRCSIHHQLKERGFEGCSRYDCLGAGQRVVQELFAGRSWQTHPELLPEMMEAFLTLRAVHQLLEYLKLLSRLPLSSTQTRARSALLKQLAPETPWTAAQLKELDLESLEQQTRKLLASLRQASTALEVRAMMDNKAATG